MNPLNNEYFGSNTTLDEKAYDHVLAAVVTFAEKVDIKDTNIEEGIDIYSPGDEYLGLFVLPSLLDACGVSYERVIGGCIATTTRGGGDQLWVHIIIFHSAETSPSGGKEWSIPIPSLIASSILG